MDLIIDGSGCGQNFARDELAIGRAVFHAFAARLSALVGNASAFKRGGWKQRPNIAEFAGARHLEMVVA